VTQPNNNALFRPLEIGDAIEVVAHSNGVPVFGPSAGPSGDDLDVQGHANIGLGGAIAADSVLNVQETNTAAIFNGIKNIIQWNPTVDAPVDGGGAESFYTELDVNVDNKPDGTAINLITTASDHELVNKSNVKKVNSYLTAGYYYFGNEGNGDCAQVNVIECDADNEGTGIIDVLNHIFIDPVVNDGGGTITECVGISISDMDQGVTNFAIKTGKGLVELGDNLKVHGVIQAGIVYSAAGTPLPAAATAGIGARAFVSDCTAAPATNFAVAYVSGGTHKSPVWSDGTGWFIG
jgi:hypothetical protein